VKTSPVSIQEAADDYGIEVHKPEAFRYTDRVEGMPPRSPFAYAALHAETGALSPPVESSGMYVVFKVLERTPTDEEEYANRAAAITERLRTEKVRAYVGYWYQQLKENAKIEDYRENA